MAFKIEELSTKVLLAACPDDTKHICGNSCQDDSQPCKDDTQHDCPEDTREFQSCQDDTRHCGSGKKASYRSSEGLSLLQRQLREQLGQGSAGAAL